MTRSLRAVLATVIYLFTPIAAVLLLAGVPPQISYQGRLTDTGGDPVADGNYQLTFSIYNVPAGGTAMWTSGAQTVAVTEGLFNYNLGSSTPLPDSIFAKNTQVYLGIKVGSDAEITPRTQLVSVGYAFQALRGDSAKYALTVADNAINSSKIADGAIQLIDLGQNGAAINQIIKWNGTAWASANDETTSGPASGWVDDGTVIRLQSTSDSIGVGTSTPSAKLDVIGGFEVSDKATIGPNQSNTGTNAFVAGANNFASGDTSAISGGTNNSAGGVSSFLGGGSHNSVSSKYGVVAGGYGNQTITFIAPFIGGGQRNRIMGDANLSVICGGDSSVVRNHIASIVGGQYNEITVNGYNGFIGGGSRNVVDANTAAIVSGYFNTAVGAESFIGGGRLHNAGGFYATIAGGYGNKTTADGAAIGGGGGNVASGIRSTVAGGSSDSATGDYSAVPGGAWNTAAGFSSLAAGYRAKARHKGTFVWADSTDADFASTGDNQFLIRATGGVGIGTDSPTAGSQLDISGMLHMRDNIKLNGNWLSNDGGDEGVWVGTDGKVGLASSSPEVRLHVLGGSDATLTGGGYITIGSTGGRNMVFDDNEIMVRNDSTAEDLVLNNDGGNVGIGTTSPSQKLHVVGNICATGTIGACSDERYKKDIETIGNALETLLKLRGVTYNWKQDEFPELNFDEEKHLGFLAQEVKDLLPGVVMTDADGYMSVDYSRLTPLLVEAMKQLKSVNDELRAKTDRITQLESRLEAQLAEVKAMMQKLSEGK